MQPELNSDPVTSESLLHRLSSPLCRFLRVFENCYMEVQFSSIAQLCPTPSDHMDCSTPGFPVIHQLLELTLTQVHRVCDAIQQSHHLLSPSLPAFNLSQHQGLFKRVSSASGGQNIGVSTSAPVLLTNIQD